MNYIDLHTDALTKTEGVFHVTRESLRAGGCLLQCFAAFIDPRKGEGFSRAEALAEDFGRMCAREGYLPVRAFSDLQEGKICAMLTVEGGGAVEGDLANLGRLYARGVRMMTLTWNFPNEIGFPNCRTEEPCAKNGGRLGHGMGKLRETEHGLTEFGREAVARMQTLGMAVDVSHGSDALFSDVAEMSRRARIPFLASHSNAAAVFPCTRNLTDGQIRILADCGGVAGLNFCAAFLSHDTSAEGQRAALLAHARRMLDAGGEDVLALGSDFDGIPQNPYLRSAADLPRLLEDFVRAFGFRVTEKIALKNALRVFRSLL